MVAAPTKSRASQNMFSLSESTIAEEFEPRPRSNTSKSTTSSPDRYTLTTSSTVTDSTSTTPSISNAITKSSLKLTNEEIELLRSSWSDNIRDSHATKKNTTYHYKDCDKDTKLASTMFASTYFWRQVHETLLHKNPQLSKCLPSVKHQTVAFAGIIYTAILNLEDLSQMDEYLGSLGRRHGRVFNVESSYFEAMGFVLIDTFSDRYGEYFTTELRTLWARLYCFLANSMIESTSTDPILKLSDLIFPIIGSQEIIETPKEILTKKNQSTDSFFINDSNRVQKNNQPFLNRIFTRSNFNLEENIIQVEPKSKPVVELVKFEPKLELKAVPKIEHPSEIVKINPKPIIKRRKSFFSRRIKIDEIMEK